jgi:flagellar basal-body rod protein FlgF/flagellar basal-body rod protein FlgG
MDSGYYAAMTGLVARTQALDTAAANLANAQTPGYRAEREFFRSVLLGPDALDSQLGQTVNNYGLLGGDRLTGYAGDENVNYLELPNGQKIQLNVPGIRSLWALERAAFSAR